MLVKQKYQSGSNCELQIKCMFIPLLCKNSLSICSDIKLTYSIIIKESGPTKEGLMSYLRVQIITIYHNLRIKSFKRKLNFTYRILGSLNVQNNLLKHQVYVVFANGFSKSGLIYHPLILVMTFQIVHLHHQSIEEN